MTAVRIGNYGSYCLEPFHSFDLSQKLWKGSFNFCYRVQVLGYSSLLALAVPCAKAMLANNFWCYRVLVLRSYPRKLLGWLTRE